MFMDCEFHDKKNKSTNIIKFSMTWPYECLCYTLLPIEDKADKPIIKTCSK